MDESCARTETEVRGWLARQTGCAYDVGPRRVLVRFVRFGQCNPAHVGRGRHGCHRITSHPYGALSTAPTRRPSSPHPARYRRARCHRSPQGPLQGRPPSTYHPASDAQQREAYSGGARGGAAMPQGERTVRRAPSLGRRGMHVRRTRQMFRASTRRRTCCPSAVSSSRIHAEL